MHCPMCVAENAVTRRFCGQCGTPLPSTCPACGFENEATAKFCGGCGKLIGEQAAPVLDITPAPARTDGAERRHLTVMFCDLVGSTKLASQLDPEDLRDVIGSYHKCVADTVSRHDGFVAKYMGDGVLVYFGYPQAHEDDAERSVRAGLAVIEAVRQVSSLELLQVRVGLATGVAVVGDLIGSGSAQEQAVVGETPNLAARLQALAGSDQLVIAENTRRLVGDLFEYENLGEVEVKGLTAPVLAFHVLRESQVRSRFEALRTDETPLIGREEEVELLTRRWEQAKAGHGCVVLISAEPGIGKSRLAEAFRESLKCEPHARLRYFCSPNHQDSALFPFISQLERAAGFERDDTPSARLDKLESLLAANVTAEGDLQLLAELLSIPFDVRYVALNLPPLRKRDRTFEALLRQLGGLAGKQPVLMVFEDLHWADPTSRELLDLAIEQIGGMPVLLLATFRPEFQRPWNDQPNVTTVSLGRLGHEESGQLVRGIIGSAAGLSSEVVAEIVERTDGVPLFLEELTKAILEASAGGVDHGLVAVASIPAISFAVPATLHSSLMARLDRLGSTAKEVAQVGAAIGRDFSYQLLAAIARHTEAELHLGLGRLAEAGLVFQRGTPPESNFLFKHALVQDAAYSTLLRSQRKELHARIGKVLEAQFPGTADTQPEILAHHFNQAGLVDRAIEYWRRAGLRSVGRSAHSEAAAHFVCALELLGRQPSSRQRNMHELELTLALAVPLIAVHGFGAMRVEECALKAKELSDTLPGSPSRFAARRLAWNSCLMRQPVPRTIALAQDLIGLAEDDTNPAILPVAHRALGYSLLIAGKFHEADEMLARGAALADAISDREFAVYGEHPSMICRAYGGQAKIMTGFPTTGARLVDEAIAYARHEENAHSVAWALAVAAHISQIHHDTAATVRFASEAMDTAREHHLPQWLALGERCMGWAMHQLGDFEVGMNLQQQGVKGWYDTGAMIHTTHCEVMLAESFLREGQTAAARAHLDNARAHRAGYGEGYLSAEIDRLEGLLLHYEQAPAEIVAEYLNISLNTARRQGARLLELRTATTFARMLAEKDECHSAVGLLAPVYWRFTEGFDTADLKEAKALLDELG